MMVRQKLQHKASYAARATRIRLYVLLALIALALIGPHILEGLGY